MKTYFITNTDSYGQRTGTFRSVELSDDQVEINRFGSKMYQGEFLYESYWDACRAALD